MAKRTSTPKVTETTHFRHDDARRKNIPTASMEAEGQLPKARRVKYAYSPHLDPVLRFDPTGRADKVAAIVDKACRGNRLDKSEQEILRAVGQNWEQPWLEWAGKQREHAGGQFTVEPVALHIHERISAQAVLRNAMRQPIEPSLFAVPEQTYAEALQFYKHDVDWANRLILGDSLQVLSSLAQRENLEGKVQMIYFDPPYGIKFRSNFQVEIAERTVGDGDVDLTREPEMLRAYRDTWQLGLHSYVTYLRDRLSVARGLLHESGSIFLQISDEQVHRVRQVLDEVFGSASFMSHIVFTKTTGLDSSRRLSGRFDHLLWYSKNPDEVYYQPLFESRGQGGESGFGIMELPSGERRSTTTQTTSSQHYRTAKSEDITKPGPGAKYAIEVYGRSFDSGRRWWGTPKEALQRAVRAGRAIASGTVLRFLRYADEAGGKKLTNLWDEFGGAGEPVYVVQTSHEIVQRALLMTTRPGDLVVDPTCGSGTTAWTAEYWGRRWVSCDTSRVALAVARHRMLTAAFPHFRTRGGMAQAENSENPTSGFFYSKLPRVTLSSVAQNTNLDPIFMKHDPLLMARVEAANKALGGVSDKLRSTLKGKLAAKENTQGRRSISEADRRRWILPPNNRDLRERWTVDASFGGWYEWELPFDTDPDWPKPLQDAVVAYRAAWRAKMDEVNKCIADNAEQEDLVDQPEVVRNVVRVSGPFTVEGVIPEELSVSDDSMFDTTPNEFEDGAQSVAADPQNLSAYLARMVAHLKTDGLTFLNNKGKRFDHLDATFEDGSGSFIHAEGVWDDETQSLVAVTFGPQYGSVTALQVEEAIRASKRYTDLVIAGFSFDAETYAIVESQQHPKLRIHIAQIRPDLNDSMDGLLKNTPNSQLFTVFGQPDIYVEHTNEGWVCTLRGVDIYNPTDNTLRSSGADKVSAWFLDSDYDGRCFCATQAFFPNRDAWEKIARALGEQANVEAFEAFNGTTSLPFEKGKFSRIAVKVIDPRGNEVMAIRTLK